MHRNIENHMENCFTCCQFESTRTHTRTCAKAIAAAHIGLLLVMHNYRRQLAAN